MYENRMTSFGLSPTFGGVQNWFGFPNCSDSLLIGALTSNPNLLRHGISNCFSNTMTVVNNEGQTSSCLGRTNQPNQVDKICENQSGFQIEADLKINKTSVNSIGAQMKTCPTSSLPWDSIDGTLISCMPDFCFTSQNHSETDVCNPTSQNEQQQHSQIQSLVPSQQQLPGSNYNHNNNTQLLDSSKFSLQFTDSGCLSLTEDTSTSLVTTKRSTSTPVHMSTGSTLISPSSAEKSGDTKFTFPLTQMKNTPKSAEQSEHGSDLTGADNQEPESTGSLTNYTCDAMNLENIEKPENRSCEDISFQESHSDSELNVSTDFICRKSRGDVKIQPYALRGNVEVFRCPLCAKDEIFSRGHLTHHLQDHQSNFKREDYKHICCFCFSELSSNSSLERHLLTHTNHRPFNCTFCEKAFTTNGNLSRHIRTSHQSKTGISNPNNAITTNWFGNSDTNSSSPVKLSGTNKEMAFYSNSTDLSNKFVNNVAKHDTIAEDNSYLRFFDTSMTSSIPTPKKNAPVGLWDPGKLTNSNLTLDNKLAPNINSSFITNDLQTNQFQSKPLTNQDNMEPIDFSSTNSGNPLSYMTGSSVTQVSNCSDAASTTINTSTVIATSGTNTTITASFMNTTNSNNIINNDKHNKLVKPTKDLTLPNPNTGTFMQILIDYLTSLNQINTSKIETRTTFAAVLAPYWSMLSGNNLTAANLLIAATATASQIKSAKMNTDGEVTELPHPIKDVSNVDMNEDGKFENQIAFKQDPIISEPDQVFESDDTRSPNKNQLRCLNSNSSAYEKSLNVLIRNLKRWKQNWESFRYIQTRKRIACRISNHEKRQFKHKDRRRNGRQFLNERLQKSERRLRKIQLERKQQCKRDCLTLKTELNVCQESHSQIGPHNQFKSIKREISSCETTNTNEVVHFKNSPSPMEISVDQNLNLCKQDFYTSMDVLDLSLPKQSESRETGSSSMIHSSGDINPNGLTDISIPKLDFPLTTLNYPPCTLSSSTNGLIPDSDKLPMSNLHSYSPRLPNEFLVAPLTSKSFITKTVTLPPGLQVPYLQKKNSYKDAPKLITCPIAGCNQKFPWNSSLKRHILTHTPHKPFACTRCTKSFSTKSNRERHMERVHRVSLKRQRQRIQLLQQSTLSNQEHPNSQTNSNISATNAISTTHESLHSNTSNGTDLNSVEELREDEIISMNSNEKQAEDISNTLLIRAGDPVVEPNPERLYSAALLAVASSAQPQTTNYLSPDLASQLARISKTNPYFLTRTFNRSKQQTNTSSHQRRQRRTIQNQSKSNGLDFNIANSTLTNQTLMDNSQTEPPIDLSMKKTLSTNSNPTLTCPICSASVTSRCLRKHMITHQTDNLLFRCHLCHLTFGDQLSTLNHWSQDHTQEWIKFTNKHNMNRRGGSIGGLLNFLGHPSSNVKSNEWNKEMDPFKSAIFLNDSLLGSTTNNLNDNTISTTNNINHNYDNVNKNPNGELITTANANKSNSDMKYVSCCVCLHRFGSQQDLQRHMRSHTGERPFVCSHCGKEFSLKHSMHRHARVHQKHIVQSPPIQNKPMVNPVGLDNVNIIKKSED